MRLILQTKEMTQQLRTPLYMNALYIMANQLLFAVFGLGFWLLAAHWYAEEDVGLGSATVSAMMLLSYFAYLGLDYAIIRFLPNAGANTGAIINSCLTLGGVASVAIALVFVTGLGVWSPALLFLQDKPAYLAIFIACTAGWTCYWIAGRTFIGKRRASFVLAQGVIFNMLRVVLVVVLASFLYYFGIFLSWGIGGMVAMMAAVLLFLPRVQRGYWPFPNIRWRVVAPMLRYSMSNYTTALLWFGSIYIMPLIVVNLLGEEENAYFFIAWQLTNILFATSIAMSFSLLAEGSYNEEKLGRDTRRSLVFTFAVVLPAVLLVILFGHRILSVFGSTYAENGADVLRVAALSAIPVSFNQIYFSVKRVEMKMKGVIAVNAFTTVGALVLSSILLHPMGITGAGVAWFSIHMVAALVVGVMWLRDIKKQHCISVSTQRRA